MMNNCIIFPFLTLVIFFIVNTKNNGNCRYNCKCIEADVNQILLRFSVRLYAIASKICSFTFLYVIFLQTTNNS